MGLEVTFVVGLVVVLGALFALSVEMVRLRGRARRLEQRAATQAHVLAAVQSRLAELGREEQTRPEGIRALLVTPKRKLAPPLAPGAKPGALAEGELSEGERPTAPSMTLGGVAGDYAALTSSASDSAASLHQEGTRDTFESVPLFDPEPSRAPEVEREAAE